MDAENVIRIMVATDSHLGYAEKDAIRGNDSFVAFEEMLELAVSNNVDFVLLGGDLFHDAVPSQNTMHKCMQLLRRYTFGDKPISLELLSDQSVNFNSAINQSVNYEDPNLNIAIPVFSIHGNHDDPSGFGRLSSLDILSSTGLVNYFGRWTDLTKVEINPLLLRKGETQLALYGLSHIHDARLARLFKNLNVAIQCPSGESEEEENWFHLMVLHQNRADRGPKNYIPEELLPNFLNLIIWGHEHDCRIEPEYNHSKDFYVSQPGSSVATSLSEGEALPKHVAILEIYKTQFQLTPLPLKTVRPFVFDSINLTDSSYSELFNEGDLANNVKLMANDRIQAMIERAKSMLTTHPKQPTLPLIRLRLLYCDEEVMFNSIRFGNSFQQQVANPNDIIHFKKIMGRKSHEHTHLDVASMTNAIQEMEIDVSVQVEDLVATYFDKAGEKGALRLMTPKALAEMCYRLVQRHDQHATENIISFFKEKAVAYLMEKLPGSDDLNEAINDFKATVSHDDILKMLDDRGSRKSPVQSKRPKPESSSDPNKGDVAASSNALKPIIDAGLKSSATAASASSSKGRGNGRGKGRGRSRVANTTEGKNTRVMPALNLSYNSKRSSTRQQKLLDFVDDGTARRTKNAIYISSDNSD